VVECSDASSRTGMFPVKDNEFEKGGRYTTNTLCRKWLHDPVTAGLRNDCSLSAFAGLRIHYGDGHHVDDFPDRASKL
jgi:hypothetical protein